MTLSFDVEGLAELQAKLGANWPKTIQAIALAIGQLIREKIAVYPKRNHGPVQWASERQRRWWHAARAEAGLPTEYSRNNDPWSERLGPGYSTEQKGGDDYASWELKTVGTTDAVVHSGASYAVYVQKADMQQPMHAATGWITDLQAIAQVKESGDVEEVIRQAVEHALGD